MRKVRYAKLDPCSDRRNGARYGGYLWTRLEPWPWKYPQRLAHMITPAIANEIRDVYTSAIGRSFQLLSCRLLRLVMFLVLWLVDCYVQLF